MAVTVDAEEVGELAMGVSDADVRVDEEPMADLLLLEEPP